MLIDDDPDLRRLIQVTLEFVGGWSVTAVADGPAGIALIRETRPDVALVDLMMPGMDGYEVCRRLKADPDTADLPVIFLTARQRLDEAQVRAAGAAGVLFKPFELDDLAPQIAALCAGSA